MRNGKERGIVSILNSFLKSIPNRLVSILSAFSKLIPRRFGRTRRKQNKEESYFTVEMEEETEQGGNLGEKNNNGAAGTRMEGHENSECDDSKPRIGMNFDTVEELWQFYKSYGKESGFPVVKKSARKNVIGELRSYTFVCGRGGNNQSTSEKPLNPQATVRCGCPAKLVARFDHCVGWIISQIVFEHNHDLCLEIARYYRCNRYVNPRIRNQIDLLDRSGVRLNKSYGSLVNEVGGHENMTCTEKDCRNLIDRLRRLRLGEGDASAIVKYFAKKVAENSGFYFAMDLDDEGHLRNVFWADGRSREAYKEFGEVISFDTTYLVNKFDMPFAPFVGVNHHGQSTLFGCGLVAHEDTDSFVWLFSKWLDCMLGCAPPAIITDQDKAMQKAIGIVFPNSRHRWCLWHVMKKLPEKFKGYCEYERITYKLKKVVYNTQYPIDFETKWREMLEKYSLWDNEWLKGLYEERRRWIPCYVKETFWAGMSTTQRSESMNAFFDGYLHSKTSLKQFVEQYEIALRDKVEKEAKADAESISKMIPTATMFEMEKQVQGMYTLSKYKEFQKELTSKMYCELIQEEEDPVGTFKYVTRECVWNEDFKKMVNFDVIFDSKEREVSCSCRMFDFKGILCRHAINVLIRQGVELLPDKYILRRWRKDVKRMHTSMKVNVSCWKNTVEHERYNKLNILFSAVADRAVKKEDEFNGIQQWLVTKLEMLKMRGDEGDVVGDVHVVGDVIGDEGDVLREEAEDVLDPKHKTRKGRPRCTRLQASWKHTNRNTHNEGNECDEVDNITAPKPKRRGRPPGSKNKKQNTVDPNGDGVIQQSQATISTQESVQSNAVLQQTHMYQPWGLYPHSHPNYLGLPMNPSAMSYFPSQGSSSQPLLPATPNSFKNMLAAMETGFSDEHAFNQ